MEAIIESLDPSEVALAKTLLANGRVTQDQIKDFLQLRKRLDSEGKPYLGDILVEKGHITKETLAEFFTENNHLYKTFLSSLVEGGYLNESQRQKILNDPESSKTIVAVMEKLGIMTKDNFIKLFSSKVNALRLGDWLLAKRKIDPNLLKTALEEQKIYRFEDYLVYHGILPRQTVDAIKDKLGLV
jgi:polyhydroxyalkanoate synthesis regulator phasin